MEIRRKMTWVGEDWSFSIIRDYTKRAEELMKYEGFTQGEGDVDELLLMDTNSGQKQIL